MPPTHQSREKFVKHWYPLNKLDVRKIPLHHKNLSKMMKICVHAQSKKDTSILLKGNKPLKLKLHSVKDFEAFEL